MHQSIASNTQNRARFLFLGFLADQDELADAFSSEVNPQVSAVKYQTALITGLTENGAEVSILSTLPISSFPGNRILFVRGKKFTLLNGMVAGWSMSFINLPLIKLVCRLLTSVPLGFAWLRRNRPTSAIIAYSLHTPFLLAAVILKKAIGVRLVVHHPDLPLHMAGRQEAEIRNLAKQLDNWLLKRLVGHADLVVPITADIAADWLPAHSKFSVVGALAPSQRNRFPCAHQAGSVDAPRSCTLVHFRILRSLQGCFPRTGISTPKLLRGGWT